MADLPYMCGQSPQQMLQLRREVNKAEMRPHAAHPCAKEFMTVTSAIDGCPMRVLDYSAKYRPGAVSTEYRDIYGYNDAVRWRLAHAEQLKGAIRCAGQPSWQGGVLNHHNRQYERLAHLQKIQKAEGCYTNEQEWRKVRFTEVGQSKELRSNSVPRALRPRVERKSNEDGTAMTQITIAEPVPKLSARSSSSSSMGSSARVARR